MSERELFLHELVLKRKGKQKISGRDKKSFNMQIIPCKMCAKKNYSNKIGFRKMWWCTERLAA